MTTYQTGGKTYQVSQRWSDEKLVISDKWTATVAWDVVGATDLGEAAAVVTAVTGVDVGAGHYRNPAMLCQNVAPERIGYNLIRVTATYAMGEPESGQNPLLLRPRIKWAQGNFTDGIDSDKSANPIFNAAGDAPDPPLTDNFTSLFLSIIRYEPYYDVQKGLLYANTYNTNVFTITGAGTVQPGQCKCLNIQPTQEYTDNAFFVEVAYEFEFRAGKLDGIVGAGGLYDGFKRRFLNAGNKGWYDDSGVKKKGGFVDPATGGALTNVPLKVNGTPVDATIRIGTQRATPVANPNGQPAGAIFEAGAGGVFFVKYMRLTGRDFSLLGL
jgi:hypothetical protein